MKRHQDTRPLRTKEGQPIKPSEAALINIDCDRSAGKFMTTMTRQQKNNPLMPEDTGAYLKINGQVIMGKLKDQILSHKHRKPCREKIMEKFKWEERTMNEIDWDSHGQAVRQIKPQQYVTIAKRNFRWQAVNEQQYRFFPKNTPSDKCPICKTAIETQDHIHTCTHWSSRKEQDGQLAALLKWLNKNKYHPYMTQMILSNMSTCMKGENRGHKKKTTHQAVSKPL